MAATQHPPSNDVILQQLRDGTAHFQLLPPRIPPPPRNPLRFFARIGPSLGGMSPAMNKLENYSVQKVTGDGRCMFRALVKGMARNKGVPLSPSQERDDADELRMAVKEIICDSDKERHQYEEALIAITVDDSLKRYCQRIQRSDFWGGESELLVLSKLCRQPITVYIPEHENTCWKLIENAQKAIWTPNMYGKFTVKQWKRINQDAHQMKPWFLNIWNIGAVQYISRKLWIT